MQNQLKLNNKSIAGIFVLLVLLVCVRIFQKNLFYDPLIAFFESSDRVLPEYSTTQLFLSLLFRYLLNTAISIGIIWLVFKDAGIVKLTAILYGVFFALLIAGFFIIAGLQNPSLLLLFYLRRFLIQPLFLILFLPAFYYQKHIR